MNKISLILGILSWIMLPFIFGPLAIIIGALNTKDKLSRVGIILGISSLIVMGISNW